MNSLQTPLRACQSGDLFALFDADGNYLASIETAVIAAEIVRRCNEYEALQSQLLAQEAAVADAWNAERDELQKRLGEVPSENLLRNYKRAAHDIGDLFCWCVANLHLFPPAPGEKPWLEGIKDRLKTGHEADSRIVDELKAMKLRAEAAEAKLAAVRERIHKWRTTKRNTWADTLPAIEAIVKEPTNAE